MPAAATRRSVRHTNPPRPPSSGSGPLHPPESRRRTGLWIGSLVLVAGALAVTVWQLFYSSAEAPLTKFEVVNEFPHDPEAYTQGLVFDQGQLYEGTGKYGESTLRRVNLDTGEIQQQLKLDRRYFGEGIAVWQDRIIQLTWRERIAFLVDKRTLQPTGQSFKYQGEGWGITTDGQSLIMSDGTSVLRFLDPRNFRVIRRLTVHEQRRRVTNLNELEYVNGEIFANVWKKDYIVRISPRTGAVVGKIDLSNLRRGLRLFDSEEVLNGIAYDAQTGRLFVTGKNWPSLFEIRLIE